MTKIAKFPKEKFKIYANECCRACFALEGDAEDETTEAISKR